jgi:hypothetical protein
MKCLPLFALLALLVLAGCQTTYTRLTVTNFDGELVSEWVAEGPVRKTEQGYAVRAVERSVEGAHPVTRRFPNGWRTTVVGANILREEVDKPEWLAALDAGGTYLSQETTEGSTERLK